MSVSVPKETFYVNPLHSLGALKINNKIHSNILNSNLNRQKILYNKCIEENEQYKLQHLIKMPRIKISRIAPIMPTNLSLINKNDINNNMKNKTLTLIKDNKTKTLTPSFSMGDIVKKNSYDIYTILMKTNMKNYNSNNKESTFEDYETTKTILNNSGIKIKREEKNFIKKINNLNNKYKLKRKNSL